MVTASDLITIRSRIADGWELREVGDLEAPAAALLLPGGLCSAAFYDDVLGYAALDRPDVRLVAATPPGFAGRPAPADVSVESFARLGCELAARVRCETVVGHSFGANIALEMAASGGFDGRLVLLSPSFSREDEFKELAVLDRIGRLPGLGRLAWAAAPRAAARSLRSSLPPERRDELAADLRRNEPQVCRRIVRRYFEYLDRHGSLVQRLCESGAPASLVFGDHHEVGLTPEERRALQACEHVTLDVVAGASHLVMGDEPKWVAELIVRVATDS